MRRVGEGADRQDGVAWRGLRRTFFVRFVVATTVSLALAVAATALLTADEVDDVVVRSAQERHAARTVVLLDVLEETDADGFDGDGNGDGIDDDGDDEEGGVAEEVGEFLEVVEGEVDVEFAGLVAQDGSIEMASPSVFQGVVVDSSLPLFDIGGDVVDVQRVPLDALVGATGLRGWQGEGVDVDELVLSTDLVQLGGERFLFIVATDADLLGLQSSRIVRSLVVASLLGLLAAAPLAWVLGGRSLLRLYLDSERRSALDPLTGVGNHRSFQEALRHQAERTTRFGRPFSVVLVDVDDFRVLNERVGHRHGDDVLVALADALRHLRGVDQAFRIGGDEFAVLLEDTDERGALVMAERLREDIRTNVEAITVSIGVASGDGQQDPDRVREEADAALFEAKRLGRDRSIGFAALGEDAPLVVSSARVQQLRDLLANPEGMGAAFQPIYDRDGEVVIGYEGLARPDTRFGFTHPGEAFDLASATGMAPDLDAACRRAILAEAAEFLPEGAKLFMNVSPEVVDVPAEGRAPLLQEVLDHGLDPSRVVLEVTERSIRRAEVVARECARLRDEGFLLALDDVGSGEAGLHTLSAMTFDIVKIDRMVAVGAMDGGPPFAVFQAILALAAASGSLVIVEGIEDDDMLSFARGQGTRPGGTVGAVQGYLLGRPGLLPGADAAARGQTLTA